MKKIPFILLIFISVAAISQPNATTILERVDRNMASENRIVESTMIIHGRRDSRTITSRSWSVGAERSFTEYLSPAREQGTKMLKLENQLWIYSPPPTEPSRSPATCCGNRLWVLTFRMRI